jgi:hypothetical protein
MRTFTAPTGRGGRSSTRESCLTRCPLLRTGRASAASGSMCEVTGWAIPTGSTALLYGRTDTNSPMVYSSMVHVAGGRTFQNYLFSLHSWPYAASKLTFDPLFVGPPVGQFSKLGTLMSTPASGTVTSYARYIGRVGALAGQRVGGPPKAT